MTGLLGADLVQKSANIASSVNVFEAVLGSVDDGFITLILIFVSIFVGTDFSLGTLKNVASRDFSKKIYIYININFIYLYYYSVFINYNDL
ncbi:hypothetical protein K2F43_22175 [Clostridium estertheticum]|uniref:hypothetical protein n=1 Tax=Clostridium estertheticum TaxID=238834 RepID=UPI001C6E3AA3|nr:hypothetical protein [Clostridium estertheticum]MBW9173876.1 hypothetical protein [Clostridium estertheticum]